MMSNSYLSDMISILSTRNGHGSMGVCLPAAWRMYSPVGVSTLYSFETEALSNDPPCGSAKGPTISVIRTEWTATNT